MVVLGAALLAWWVAGWKLALCVLCPALAVELTWHWLSARAIRKGGC